MTLVSVIVPCRNGEPFVADAVRSVLAQNVDLEVVLVDDGSTDTSVQSVRAIGDPRVRIIEGPRTGVSSATNAALPHLRGQLMARCDADDLYPPGRLEWQCRWMNEHPQFDAVCGRFLMMTRDGSEVSEVAEGAIAEEVTAELSEGTTRTHFNTWMCRTAVIRALGGCRDYFTCGEDIDLMLRHAPAHRVWYEPRTWYRYRLHEGTTTHSMPSNQRVFLEQKAREFARQRQQTGADDLMRGAAPPVPEGGNCKPSLAAEQVQGVLLGRAWKEHRSGKKREALSTGVRACLTRPANFKAWRSLLVLALRPAGDNAPS